MVKERLSGAVRGVAVVSMAVVAVIAGAGVLSTWRYDVASARGAIATDDRQDATTTVALTAAFWRERQALDKYFFEPSPAVMREVTGQRDEIRQLFAALGTPSTSSEARSLAQAMAAQARYESTFTQLRSVASTGLASQFVRVNRLEATAAGVLPPLETLATMLEESILATQQQKSAADQVDSAIQQIRDAADQLAAEQTQWSTTAERLDTLVGELDIALQGSVGSARR